MTPEDDIETAYRVFSRYRLNGVPDFAARVGASDAENSRQRDMLERVPLRDLPLETVAAYVDYIDAAHYDGGYRADEFRYFLPRILELIAGDPGRAEAYDLPDMLERILARGRARQRWPAEEVDAIGHIVRGAW